MKIVIIGGVAAGPKTAARLRRLQPDAEITIVEQGDLISYGACGLPLYLGNLVPDLTELMMTSYGSVRDPDYFYLTKQVKVLTNTRAEEIDRDHKFVKVRNLIHNQEDSLPYDFLVLATGASPTIPNLPGKDLPNVFTLHHPNSAKTLRDLVRSKKIKHVTVIGAGLIGMEAADALSATRMKVSLCEAQAQLLPKVLDSDMAVLVEKQVKSRGVEIHLSCTVQALLAGEDGNVARVETSSGTIETNAVILAIGTRPNVKLAGAAGLKLGVTNGIQVNSQLQTSDPFIYAGGDCIESYDLLSGQPVYFPLASTANKHGRIIADNIAGIPSSFPGVAKTTVLQCYDLNIGRTGLSEAEAVQKGLDITSVKVSGFDATHYHPMHDKVTLKLIAEKHSERVMGAQVVGLGEGIKRLDVLITAMKFEATLEDIANLDLGYAPPFSTAIDLVAHAANTLRNKINGIVDSISGTELFRLLANQENITILDIRSSDEVQSSPIPFEHKIEVPLSELHSRWQELPEQTRLIVVCELGIRSYEAACMLKGKGINVAYLEGGLSVLGS